MTVSDPYVKLNLNPLLSFLILVIMLPATVHAQDEYLNRDVPLGRMLDSLNGGREEVDVLIDKSEYKLSVMAGAVVMKQYPVVFGTSTMNDKLRQGDKCTPEGTFAVRDKYPHPRWSKFIWIDYPNEQSWEKHNRAKREGEIREDADIGGEIGIHGVPSGMNFLIDLRYNWTLGCISLKNDDVDELFPYIEPGVTTVTIIK
mgnify:CR=1 FL=1